MQKTYNRHPLTEEKLEDSLYLDLPEIEHKNKDLAIFTIGPVQSFISAAKKVKEYWAGSYLLSFLTWGAIEHTLEEVGAENIIFPSIKGQPFYDKFIEGKDEVENLHLPTFPNRFMAYLPSDKSRNILNEAEKKVEKKLINIAHEEGIIPDEKGDRKLFNQQLERFLEIYWVAIPADVNKDKLKKKYRKLKNIAPDKETAYAMLTGLAEEMLGSRKNFRSFEFVKEEGKDELNKAKCFICGLRGALVEIKFEEEERGICGVCALKREFEKYYNNTLKSDGSKEVSYPSVIEIAAMDYKEKLVNKASETELNSLEEAFRASEIEDYSINILPEKWKNQKDIYKKCLRIKGNNFDLENEAIQDTNAYEEIKKLNRKYNLSLNKYYGLIYLDGDDMGKWVSGERTERDMTPEMHGVLSRALNNYSLKLVDKAVEKDGRLGKVIYAGGDDVVAFVNLANLFTTMRELRAYFSGNIDKNGRVDLFGKGGIVQTDKENLLMLGSKASISLGLCIAHYKEPLNLVIKTAKEMESRAKNNEVLFGEDLVAKDAFAISLLKSSGERKISEAKWTYNNIDLIAEGIKPLIKLIEEDKLSRNFIHVLKNEFQMLGMDKAASEGILEKIITSEVKRLLSKKKKNLNSKEEEQLISSLNKLACLYKYRNAKDEFDDLNNFISLLEILFFLGKKGG